MKQRLTILGVLNKTLLLVFAAFLLAGSGSGQQAAQVRFRLRLADPDDHVRIAMFSPDGSKILLVCDRSTQVWSAESGKLLFEFPQKIDLNNGKLKRQPGGTKLLQFGALYKPKRAYLWDTADGKLLATMDEKGGIARAEWNRDGTRILTVGEPIDTHNLNIRRSEYTVRDAHGRLIVSGKIEGTYAMVTKFAGDGKRLIINVDGARGVEPIRIVNADTGNLEVWFEQAIANSTFDYERFVAESPDGRYICGEIEDSKGTACWSRSAGKEPLYYLLDNKQTGDINFLSFSPDSARFAVSKKRQKAIEIIDSATGKTLSILNNPFEARVQFYKLWNPSLEVTTGDTWSPDGRYFVASDIEKRAYVWDTRSGKMVATLPLTYHESYDWFVGTLPRDYEEFYFQPRGDTLMSVGFASVKLWSPESGKLLQLIDDPTYSKKHSFIQKRIAGWSPDGGSILSSTDENRTVVVWSVNR